MISNDVKFEGDVLIHQPELVNLYGCVIGGGSRIGAFVEIQRGVVVGRNCKISSHSFICEGVTIEDSVFIGHNVSFINDRMPRATTPDGRLIEDGGWTVAPVRARKGASIWKRKRHYVRCDYRRRGDDRRGQRCDSRCS